MSPANTYIHNLPSFVTFPLIFHFFISIWTQQREKKKETQNMSSSRSFSNFQNMTGFYIMWCTQSTLTPTLSTHMHIFLRITHHRVYRVATAAFLRTVHFSMIKWAKAEEQSIYHHVQSCSVRSSWEGRYTPSVSSLPICTLCYTQWLSFWAHLWETTRSQFPKSKRFTNTLKEKKRKY